MEKPLRTLISQLLGVRPVGEARAVIQAERTDQPEHGEGQEPRADAVPRVLRLPQPIQDAPLSLAVRAGGPHVGGECKRLEPVQRHVVGVGASPVQPGAETQAPLPACAWRQLCRRGLVSLRTVYAREAGELAPEARHVALNGARHQRVVTRLGHAHPQGLGHRGQKAAQLRSVDDTPLGRGDRQATGQDFKALWPVERGVPRLIPRPLWCPACEVQQVKA